MIKTLYIIVVVVYAVAFVSFFFKQTISYRIVGIPYEIVNGNRDLTLEEYAKVKRAEKVTKFIFTIVLVLSIITAVVSVIIWYLNLFSPAVVPKIVFAISGLFAIILIIVNGIHFIPSPPIR